MLSQSQSGQAINRDHGVSRLVEFVVFNSYAGFLWHLHDPIHSNWSPFCSIRVPPLKHKVVAGLHTLAGTNTPQSLLSQGPQDECAQHCCSSAGHGRVLQRVCYPTCIFGTRIILMTSQVRRIVLTSMYLQALGIHLFRTAMLVQCQQILKCQSKYQWLFRGHYAMIEATFVSR